jgi:hypothetical protein
MNNQIEKDTIGEHEGLMNNPMLAFFIALGLIALFYVIGNILHVGNRAETADSIARKDRFEKLKQWRTDNTVDLESYSIVSRDESGKPNVYQIPLSEAKELVLKEYTAK